MTWDEIKDEVEKNGNLKTFTMEQLRDANGSSKLGVNVRAEISETLAGMGLGHVPVDLPNYQNEQVRIYKNGTPVGELISVVLNPGEQNDSKITSRFVAVNKVDYPGLVQKIRELVSE